MSPKTVFIVFGVVIGLVVALVVVRTASNRSEVPPVQPIQEGAAQVEQTPSGVNLSPMVVTNVVATTPDQDKEMAREQSIDELKDALLDDPGNQATLDKVRLHLRSEDADVRKMAVVTLMHLNDAAAIPALKEALERVQDPREKVAIMDAIDYLETPEDPMVTGSLPTLTNSADLPSAAK